MNRFPTSILRVAEAIVESNTQVGLRTGFSVLATVDWRAHVGAHAGDGRGGVRGEAARRGILIPEIFVGVICWYLGCF